MVPFTKIFGRLGMIMYVKYTNYLAYREQSIKCFKNDTLHAMQDSIGKSYNLCLRVRI